MSDIQTIDLKYEPNKYQAKVHVQRKRFNCIVAHRGLGKTYLAVHELVDSALRCDYRNPIFSYIAPSFSQAKKIAWSLLKEKALVIPGASSNEQDLKLTIKRGYPYDDEATIYLMGAENPGGIRGIHQNGCVIDEYAEMHPLVWTEVVRPTLSRKKGFAIFIGTFKGMNHFYDLYTKASTSTHWFTANFKASETKVIDDEELAIARESMSEQEYMQEYENDPSAGLVGAYFSIQMKAIMDEGRITNVPYNPSMGVETWWDLGADDSTAIWFVQHTGTAINIIDYVEDTGNDISHYIRTLATRPYRYSRHLLPHDAAAKTLATGGSLTVEAQLRDSELAGRVELVERHRKHDQIEAARLTLPICYFDKSLEDYKTPYGGSPIDALRQYQKKWDSKKKVFSTEPLHNWASHCADAFMVGAIARRSDDGKLDKRNLPRQAVIEYDPFDLVSTGG